MKAYLCDTLAKQSYLIISNDSAVCIQHPAFVVTVIADILVSMLIKYPDMVFAKCIYISVLLPIMTRMTSVKMPDDIRGYHTACQALFNQQKTDRVELLTQCLDNIVSDDLTFVYSAASQPIVCFLLCGSCIK